MMFDVKAFCSRVCWASLAGVGTLIVGTMISDDPRLGWLGLPCVTAFLLCAYIHDRLPGGRPKR